MSEQTSIALSAYHDVSEIFLFVSMLKGDLPVTKHNFNEFLNMIANRVTVCSSNCSSSRKNMR